MGGSLAGDRWVSRFITSFGATPVVDSGLGANPELDAVPNQGYKTDTYREQLFNTIEAQWRRSGFGGGLGMQASAAIQDNMSQMWDWSVYASPGQGTHVPKKVSGQVIDSNNNPVSGATVQLFNTSTGLLVDTQTTGAGGTYVANDPNATTNFANAYLSGSPDTAGTTIDTISGT